MGDGTSTTRCWDCRFRGLAVKEEGDELLVGIATIRRALPLRNRDPPWRRPVHVASLALPITGSQMPRYRRLESWSG